MTALTINGSAVAATTVVAAGKLFTTTGGTSGSTSTKVGSGTLFKQIFAKGTSTNQTGVASIPAPTDSNFNGWIWDVTTLEGQLLQAGTLTPTMHLLASTSTTVTPALQWFKRSSGGVYTQLATVTGSSLALTTSSQALTFTAPSMSDTAFATGDKLVMWLWVNQTAGGATNSTISVVEATSGSTAGVASEAQTVTPGFIPIVTTTYSFTDGLVASESATLFTGNALPLDALVVSSSLLTLDGESALSSLSLTDSSLDTGGSSFVDTTALWALRVFGAPVLLTPIATSDSLSSQEIGLFTTGLSATDNTLEASLFLPIDSLTVNDSASTMTQVPAGVTTTTYSFMDVLTVSDSLAQIGLSLASEGLSIGESLLETVGNISTDGLLASDTLLGMDSSLYTEATIGSSTLVGTGSEVPSSSLEAGSHLLALDGDTSLESLTGTSSFLEASSSTSTDGLLISDGLLVQESSFLLESLQVGESLLGTSSTLALDALTIADLGGGFRWPVDALTITESFLTVGGTLPLDPLSSTETDLNTTSSLLVEMLAGDDSASTMASVPSGSLVTTTYSFGDALAITDILFMIGNMSPTLRLALGESLFQVQEGRNILLEGNSASDSLVGQDGTLVTESMSPTDFLTGIDTVSLPAEVGSLVASLSTSGVYISLDTGGGGADTYGMASSYMPVDQLPPGDMGNMQRWGIESLVITEGFTIHGVWNPPVPPLSGASSVLMGDVSLWGESIPGSDIFQEHDVLPPPHAVLSPSPIGSLPPAYYEGKAVAPARPSGVYMVNGIPLDSQPIVCTAPLEAGGGLRFLVGSTFFLLFDRPSMLTQSLLSDGGMVSMTFALASGNMVTVPQVQVASTLVMGVSISTLAVTCTLLSSLATPTLSLASSS